jgi:ubiquitin carboxyl-terminal hydrolase 25/28
MYQIGFAGTEGPEGYISGPFLQNELVSAESVTQMDQYMARTWVEVSLALQAFQIRNGRPETKLSR